MGVLCVNDIKKGKNLPEPFICSCKKNNEPLMGKEELLAMGTVMPEGRTQYLYFCYDCGI
jgi:hypothetical protein